MYSIEQSSRKLFMMFKEKQKMEEKSANILKLFPESLAIVDIAKNEFLYYNEPFASFISHTLLEKSHIINDLSRDYLSKNS